MSVPVLPHNFPGGDGENCRGGITDILPCYSVRVWYGVRNKLSVA